LFALHHAVQDSAQDDNHDSCSTALIGGICVGVHLRLLFPVELLRGVGRIGK
jgi:hypothetical protein